MYTKFVVTRMIGKKEEMNSWPSFFMTTMPVLTNRVVLG